MVFFGRKGVNVYRHSLDPDVLPDEYVASEHGTSRLESRIERLSCSRYRTMRVSADCDAAFVDRRNECVKTVVRPADVFEGDAAS